MSADVWLEIDTGAGEPTHLDGTDVNLTHNLTPMLRAAGFPGWRAFEGAPASESAGVFAKVAAGLRANPERFRAMNPPNGWGTYEGALEVMERLRDLCARHPKATIGAWL